MEFEISQIPPLAPGELSILNAHSLLNVYNVLRGELVLLGLKIDQREDVLAGGLKRCDRLISAVGDPYVSLADATRLATYEEEILGEIDRTLQSHPLRQDPEVVESLGNLKSVFEILRVRARELLARVAAPGRWETCATAEIEAEVRSVLAAIEKNSKGRFRIVYNLAAQNPNDYYVDFRVDGATAGAIRMPAVFKDVIRDLIANARKYTPPGGQIRAALHGSEQELRFVVEDTGRGIPATEIPLVVHFGRRASNVGDVRTMGGGFGLTKAFLITKQFGGRMWIDSALRKGTKVRIVIPVPASSEKSRDPGQVESALCAA